VQIAIIGSGSWGTALAKVLGDHGHEVALWARRSDLAASIDRGRENAIYLPGFSLGASVRPTASLPEALDHAGLVMFVVPSHGLRAVAREASRVLLPDVPVVTATKGLETRSLV
jgi:glycerol-3-phosphate dehydrogenase (NAD(P)+)